MGSPSHSTLGADWESLVRPPVLPRFLPRAHGGPNSGPHPAAMSDVTGLSERRAADFDAASPAVDVVVPVYNEAATLDRSIQQLHAYLSSRFPFSWRITIADNASTDESWAIAARCARD